MKLSRLFAILKLSSHIHIHFLYSCTFLMLKIYIFCKWSLFMDRFTILPEVLLYLVKWQFIFPPLHFLQPIQPYFHFHYCSPFRKI